MRHVVLQRIETGDEGTFGTLEVDGAVFHTGELPWRDNKHDVSCIPAGTYICHWHVSPHFGPCYEIANVPDRTDCLIHKGNWCGDVALGYASDVKGCTLLGRARGILRNKFGHEQKAVTASGPAIADFHRMMNEEDFEIEVRDVPANA